MTTPDVEPAGAVERLLAELEPLTFNARMQRMLELGRAAAAEPPDLSKQQLIDGLGACGRYGQLLAGQARQQAEAVTLSRQLQDTATAAGAAVQLDPALLAMHPEALRVRLAQMHKAGCWAAHLHQLVETLAEQGDKPRLAEALCYGSPTQVEVHWRPVLSWALGKEVKPGPGPSPFLINTGTATRNACRLQCQLWTSVSKHHPSFIAQQVGGSGSALNLVLRNLSAQCPQEALRLYQGLTKAERARVQDVQRLLEHFPTEVVELALARDKPEAPDAAAGAAEGLPASSPAELSASSSLVEWEVVSSEGSAAQLGAGGSPAAPAPAAGSVEEAAVEQSTSSSAAVYELLQQVPVYSGPRFRLRTRYLERMPRDLLLRVLLSGQWGAGDVLSRVGVEQRAQLVEDWTAWYAGQYEALRALLAQARSQGEEGRAVQGAVGIAREVEAQAFALWQVQSGSSSLYSVINRLSPDEEEQVLESCMRQAPEFLRGEMSGGWLTSRLVDWARWGELSRVLHAHSRLLLEGGEHVEARLACLMPLLSAQEQVSLHRLRHSQQQEDEAEARRKQEQEREAAAGAQGPDALRELHQAEAAALLKPLFCAAASDPALLAQGGNKADLQAVAAALAAALASSLQGEELRSVAQLLHQPRADALGQNPALNPMTRLLAPANRGQAKDAVQSAAGVLALRLLPEALVQVFEDWESWWQQVLPRLFSLVEHLAPAPHSAQGSGSGGLQLPPALHDLSDALATASLGRLAPRTSSDELLHRALAAAARAIRAEVLQRAVEPWLTCPPPPAAPQGPGPQPTPWLLLPPLQRLRFLRLCLKGAGSDVRKTESAGADPKDWGVEQLTATVLKTLPKVDFKSELCRCSPLTDDEAALLLASPQALEEVLKDGALLTRLPAASRSQLTELHSQQLLDLVLREPPLIKELPESAHLLLSKLSPTAFTDNVPLLTLLTPKAQVQVLQVYANVRSAKERALGTLLASTPGHISSAALSSKLRSELSTADPLAVEGATAGDKLCAPARELLFKACREVWVNEGWDTKAALALLPQPYRTAIARTRAQELAVLARSPGAVKPGLGHKERAVLTWLPWEELVAHPILAGMLQNKDAAVRTDALVHLFQAAQQQPSLIPPLLAALHARRREGDPVRQVMLTHLQLLVQARLKVEAAEEEAAAQVEAEALAAGSPGQGGASSGSGPTASPTSTSTPGPAVGGTAAEQGPRLPALLPAISVIVEDALAAKDLSRGSLSHLSCMLANLLGSPHVAFACSTLAPCARGWGLAALPLDQMSSSIQKRLGVISEAAKRRAAAAAAPLLRSLPPSNAASLAQLPLGRSARWARVKARAPLTAAEAGEGDGEEVYLMQVVAGSSSLMEAMRQRQDGVQDAIKLLRMLWKVCSAGRTAERFELRLKPQLMELAHVTVGMLEAASAGAGTAAGAGARGAAGLASGPGSAPGPGVVAAAAPAAAAPGLAVLAAGEELEFLGKLLLEHAPDTFPRIQHHVFSSPPGSSQTAAHCLSAMRLLDAVPPTRPDLLLTFISANRSMPGVGARALQLLQANHKEVLSGAMPALFEAEPSLAVLPEVRDQLLNVRQDLLWPLLKGPVLGGMYAEEPPLSPEYAAKEFKRACRICFWLAVPRPTSSQLLTWTPAQQTALADILGKVLRRGTLSLSDSKSIVNLIADLEFVPPTGLLALLQEPGAGAGAGGAEGEGSGAVDEEGKPLLSAAAAGAEAPGEGKAQLVSEAMRDCVLAALARRLGDSNAVWEALVQASATGDVNAALAAVSSLHNFNSAGAGAGGVKLEAADVLVRLRSIPWKRAAVTKQVVKLLGKLVPLVPEAFTDLMSIAGSSSMQGVQLQLVGTCIAFLHRPEAKAYVLAAAANHADTDVAMAAAVVPAPPHEPGVLQAVVEIFVTLLAHPSPLVRSHAMAAWSTAATPVPLALGLPVASAMLAIAKQPKATTAEQAEARRHASAWFMSVG